MKPDKVVILKSVEGAPVELSTAERRFAANHAGAASLTSELRNRMPDPTDPRAADMLLQIRDAHRAGDGDEVVALCEAFRARYGWHGRAEWFRVLGLELTHDPSLVDEQLALVTTLDLCLAGEPPVDATPTTEQVTPAHLRWLLSGNTYNLAEWLRTQRRFEEALHWVERSFEGVEPSDVRRLLDRMLLRAYLLLELDRAQEAKLALDEARALGREEFDSALDVRLLELPALRRFYAN